MDAQPEFDASGTLLGGSLVWASARDFAKRLAKQLGLEDPTL